MTDTPMPDRFDEMAREIVASTRIQEFISQGENFPLAEAIAAALRQQHIELKAESAKLREELNEANADERKVEEAKERLANLAETGKPDLAFVKGRLSEDIGTILAALEARERELERWHEHDRKRDRVLKQLYDEKQAAQTRIGELEAAIHRFVPNDLIAAALSTPTNEG